MLCGKITAPFTLLWPCTASIPYSNGMPSRVRRAMACRLSRPGRQAVSVGRIRVAAAQNRAQISRRDPEEMPARPESSGRFSPPASSAAAARLLVITRKWKEDGRCCRVPVQALTADHYQTKHKLTDYQMLHDDSCRLGVNCGLLRTGRHFHRSPQTDRNDQIQSIQFILQKKNPALWSPSRKGTENKAGCRLFACTR